MLESTWLIGFLGGLLIGLAAACYLLVNGKIMGVSGILGGLFTKPSTSIWRERCAFIAGLVLMPVLLMPFYSLPDTQASSSIALLIIAGILVGWGTRMGSGCTSGHGICGLSRFSLRSVVATLTFMAAGMVTVFIMRMTGVGL